MKLRFPGFSSEGGGLLIDSATYMLAKAVPGGLGLLSVVIFVNLVGEVEFGRYAVAFAIVNTWAAAAGGWFYQGVLRMAGRWPTQRAEFAPVARRGLSVASVGFGIAALAHFAVAPQVGSLWVIGSALALGIFMILQSTLLAVLQAQLAAKRAFAAEFLRSSLGFAAAIGLSFLASDRVAGLILGTALGYAFSLYLSRPRRPCTQSPQVGGSEPPTLCAIWRYGWPLSLWYGGQLAMPLIDRSLIAADLGMAETGRFTALSELFTRCFSIILFPIIQALLPRAIRLWDSNDREGARALLVRTWQVILALGSVSVLVAYLASPLVGPVLAMSHSPEPALVVTLASGGLVWQLALLAHKPLELAGRTREMFAVMAVATGLKFAMTKWLLASSGPLGAAIATLLAGLLYCGVTMWLSQTAFNHRAGR